jgi:hypothetical protein
MVWPDWVILTLHLLSNSHVSPPRHSDTFVEQYGWEDTVRSDHVQFLDCLICDRGDTGVRYVADYIASGRVRDIVDRGKHARNCSDNRIASANALRILEDAAVGGVSVWTSIK